MTRHFATVIILLVVVATFQAAATSVAQTSAEQPKRQLLQSPKFEICKSAFDNLGGSEEQVAQKLPACAGSQPVLGDCCGQVKGLLSQAPSDCLCDADVWDAVQSRAGGNAGTLKQFLGACSIPNRGSGTC